MIGRLATAMEPERFTIRLSGSQSGEDVIEADSLVKVLQGVQKVIYMIAMDTERAELQERARPPADIRTRYGLVCSQPQPGSYSLPMTLGAGPQRAVPELLATVSQTFQRLLRAAGDSDNKAVAELFRNDAYRARALSAIETMAPAAGSRMKVGITRNDEPEIVLNGGTRERIRRLRSASHQERVPEVVTGWLHAIDFAAREATLLYPPTGRELTCYYEESVEVLLIESRRDLVQVTGTVVIDSEDYPTKITDVERFDIVDLTDFVVEEVPYDHGVLRFSKPLVLQPTLSESKQLMCLREDALALHVFAHSRDELLEELHDQIRMLWVECALEADEALVPSARELKGNLLNLIEEVVGGN